MKLCHILLLILISPANVFAQRVISKVEDMHSLTKEKNVKNIRNTMFPTKKIIVEYNNNITKMVSADSIWGYENKRNHIFRYSEEFGYFCMLIQEGDICVYSKQGDEYAIRNNFYFFSKGLNGKIYLISKKNLAKLTKDESASIQKWIK